MRIYTLATTVMIGAGLVTTDAKAADKVQLELGGSSKWFVVGAWNNPSYSKATEQSFNNVDVKGQADLIFSGSTTLDNGLQVGVETVMVAGTNTGVGGGDETNFIDSAYLYVDSGYGKVNLGALQNGTHLIHVQAPEAIGQWADSGLLTDNNVIQAPDAIIGINGNQLNSTSILPGQSGAISEGITYLSPTFYGITLAASYVPNDLKNMRGPVNIQNTVHDFFGAGINYTDNFGDFGIQASAAWAHANIGSGSNAPTGSSGKIDFYNAGLNLSYSLFTLGGSFRWNAHNERGQERENPLSLDGHAWDLGLIYDTGSWTAGLSWYQSNVVGNSYKNGGKKEEVMFIQTSGSYNLGPGVNLQGLVGYGDYKASTAGNAPRGTNHGNVNRGWTALGGVAIEF